MSEFEKILSLIKEADYKERQGLFDYLINGLQRGLTLNKEDKAALTEYAEKELETIQTLLAQATCYKEKNPLLYCGEALLTAIVLVFPNGEGLPAGLKTEGKAAAQLIKEERYIETAIDQLFSQEPFRDDRIDRILSSVRETEEEYHKGLLYVGLHHYQNKLSLLSEQGKKTLANFLAEEIKRYLAMDVRDEDSTNNLELIADVCKHFPGEETAGLLHQLFSLKNNSLNYYAVETLLALKEEVPDEVVDTLAKDMVYADLTYGLLRQHGAEDRFPAECADEIYLAKSDMIHWLTYPTELGKVPDEIEYIGKIKKLFSKEVFHVFKFRSDSDNLGDELKNKWLIGWSSNEGGTFSNFDEYALFEKQTTEKTLKNIKKKLIG